MLTLISANYKIISALLMACTFVVLGYLFLFKKQNPKLNWALFYSFLYVGTTLPIIHYWCVALDFWYFTAPGLNSIKLPFDLYFLWVVFWSIFPVILFKGKYLFLLTTLIFWLDILLMPILEKSGLLILNNNWLIGELILIAFVFIPSYLWASCSYKNKHHDIRALFQVIVMAAIFLIGLPFILASYGIIDHITVYAAPFIFQLLFILIFPSLVAVVDIVQKGKGTPFPFDPTKNLIQTGVYAYCRNPIQWSFALLFIPLSIYFKSYYFLLGTLASIAYAYGVSDYHEYPAMQQRFGKSWDSYKNTVPKWRFLWIPKTIPKGEIYFDTNCTQCDQLRKWFSSSRSVNLEIKSALACPKKTIFQVTYIDHHGTEFKSVQAIACALEHINLAYASLGWFMRFPGITWLLQLIVDTMVFRAPKNSCEVE